MAKKSFSIGDSIKYGWTTTKKNFKFFAVLLLIIAAVNFVPSFLNSAFEDSPGIVFLVSLISWGLQILVSLGIIRIALKIYDKKAVKHDDLFKSTNLIIPYFLGSLIYGAIVFAGFLLLIIPGIIWSIKFGYYTYFMVDKNMGPIDALKASSAMTKNIKWKLLGFGIIAAVINILGVFAILIGLFWTVPTTMMAQAYIYRKLTS